MDRDQLVANANVILEHAHGQISSAILLAGGFGVFDHSESFVYDQVLASRFLKKFERPEPASAKARKGRCLQQWIDIDEELRLINFDAFPNDIKSTLYKAKHKLTEWLDGFKPSDDIEFTPGETFESSRGRCSVIRKLASKQHWTVTYDAFDDFAAMCYNTTGLKRAARRLMKPLTAAESRELFSASGGDPFVAFSKRLEGVVTLTHGSRLTTVRKNNSTDRAINVEPMGNMLLQRRVAGPLRGLLRDIGNDLEIGQQVHRSRISAAVATIDFSAASDRISLDIVCRLFPASVTRLLRKWRSQMCLVEGTYHLPRKLSSMGCGFTFEVMTLLLLSVARVFDPEATVYGDDVIISNEHAARFIDVCNAIGMKVNTDKSFVNAPFRESCGAYFHDAIGYIECYDIKWCENWADVTTTANKLLRCIRSHPFGSKVKDILADTHARLCSIAPATSKGAVNSNISCGFIMHEELREQKKDKQVRNLFNHVRPILTAIAAMWQMRTSDFGVCKVIVKKPKLGWITRNGAFPDQGPKYLASLKAGRVAVDSIRGECEEVEKLIVWDRFGGVHTYSELVDLAVLDGLTLG